MSVFHSSRTPYRMRPFTHFLLLELAAALATGPVANTPYGPVRGFVVNETRAWRGIRYAAPPLRDLRFRPPQPPSNWTTVIDTIEFGASCMQAGSPGDTDTPGWNSLNLTKSSEDCLFVNVYAPNRSDMLFPVLVYLHAGEFRFGSANDLENNWPYFAIGQAVVVTGNIRLGLLGYAALDALRSRDPSGSTGNYGVQDQRATLKWVKQCIASFGGNAEKITIFGESSGGSSVAFHLTSKASQGFFSQAILQSPGLTQSKSWSDAVANTNYAVAMLTAAGSAGCGAWPAQTTWNRFGDGLEPTGHVMATVNASIALAECAKMANCSAVASRAGYEKSQLFGGGTPGKFVNGVVGFKNETLLHNKHDGVEIFFKAPDPVAAVECLVGAHVLDLIALNQFPLFDDTFITDSVAPTIDGVELAEPLEKVTLSSVPEGIPVLAGSNLDEGTEFLYLLPDIACNANESELAKWAIQNFGPSLGPQLPDLYEDIEQPAPLCESKDGENTSKYWLAAMRAAGDSAILCRTRELLRAYQQQGSSVWWYYFTHTPNKTVNMDGLQYLGAFHGAEVPFVWGDGFEIVGDGEQALSKAMGCYWVNFAATGNPNAGPSGCAAALSLPSWPQFADGDALEFSTGTWRNRTALKQAQCDTFAAYHSPSASLDTVFV